MMTGFLFLVVVTTDVERRNGNKDDDYVSLGLGHCCDLCVGVDGGGCKTDEIDAC